MLSPGDVPPGPATELGAFSCRGKIVLGYTEAELRMCGTGYQFIHAADMLYCAENHIRSKSPFPFMLTSEAKAPLVAVLSWAALCP